MGTSDADITIPLSDRRRNLPGASGVGRLIGQRAQPASRIAELGSMMATQWAI
jgi:hypothetical protein